MTIAEDANLSRSQLNVILASLEKMCLLRRVRRFDPETKRQRSTRYTLGFESEFAQEPDGEPSPISGQSRVRKSDALNPVKESVSEPARARGRPAA